MARPEVVVLEVPTAVGVGIAANVFRFRDKTVQVAGTFSGTLQLEGSIVGGEYAPLGAPVSAPALVRVPEAVQYLRVRLTALASGAPVVALAGFDVRAE